ncbi:MAG: copper resistance CopC family protein, partial [Methylococcales bacterium]
RALTVFAALSISACLVEPGNVVAHAVVTESSLRATPIKPEKETPVMLHFNSRVELSLSKFELVRKGDTHEAVTAKPGSKPGQIIVVIPPLSPGDYAIHYKVFAADGHLTEDIMRFSVAAQPGSR